MEQSIRRFESCRLRCFERTRRTIIEMNALLRSPRFWGYAGAFASLLLALWFIWGVVVVILCDRGDRYLSSGLFAKKETAT